MYTQQSPVETYKLLDLIFNLCSNKNHPMGNREIVTCYHLDFDNQKLTIKVNNSGIQMPTDDQVQIIDYITLYANGDLDIQLLDR